MITLLQNLRPEIEEHRDERRGIVLNVFEEASKLVPTASFA